MKWNKSSVLKIAVPVLILVAIFGMWFLKSSADNLKISDIPEVTLSSEYDGADFSLNATTQIDFAALAEYGLPVIADYGSDSCIPCKQMAPVLETMNKEMQGKALIKFVDVWKYTDAADNVPIRLIPTQVFFNADGTPFVPSDALAIRILFDIHTDRTTGEHIFTTHQGGLTEEQMRMILAEMGVE